MASETKAPNQEPTSSSNTDESARFECNICLDAAKDAVVSLCGHLFCWPCLSQWLDTRPNNQVCPVCKSAIDGNKVVPIYGRGGDSSDPRSKVPPRPKGQRTESPQQTFAGFNWGGEGGMMGGGLGSNVQFSFGIGTVNGLFPLMFMLPLIQGIFPLTFVASWFGGNGGNHNNNQGNGGTEGGADGAADGTQHAHGHTHAYRSPYGETAAPGSRMAQEEEYLSNIFKYIGFFMLFWLLFV